MQQSRGDTHGALGTMLQALEGGELTARVAVRAWLRTADLAAITANKQLRDRCLSSAYRLAREHNLILFRCGVIVKRLWWAFSAGRVDVALNRAIRLAQLAEKQSYAEIEVICAMLIGSCYWSRGELLAARKTIAAAPQLTERVPAVLATPLIINLGLMLFDLGQFQEAAKVLRRGLRYADRSRNLVQRSYALLNLASAQLAAGHAGQAERTIHEYLWLAGLRSDRTAIGWYYLNLGYLKLRSGDYQQAESSLLQATETLKELGMSALVGGRYTNTRFSNSDREIT